MGQHCLLLLVATEVLGSVATWDWHNYVSLYLETSYNCVVSDILPQADNWEGTEAFLKTITQLLFKYIQEENKPESKLLEFHHPAEMQRLVDLSIPDHPQSLQELVRVRDMTWDPDGD